MTKTFDIDFIQYSKDKISKMCSVLKLTHVFELVCIAVQRMGISFKEIVWPTPWHWGLKTSGRRPQRYASKALSLLV